MAIDQRGYARDARQCPSPNCDARPAHAAVTLLVVHSISLPPGEFSGDAIERLFTNRLDPAAHPYFCGIASLRVSAHFLIRRSGELVQFVPVGGRAWHAGASSWRARARCNDISVGVEFEGVDDAPFEPAQYARIADLLPSLRAVLPIRDIAAHSDIAPGRKRDPGSGFDWNLLLRALAGASRAG